MADKDDNNMKETLESIRRAIGERLGSAVIGTFVLFWLIFNWPVLVLLWKSELPIEDTITAIYATRLTLFRSFIYPAIGTAAYLLIYPWISFIASIYDDWINKRRILRKQKQEVEILKSKSELFAAEADLEMIKLGKKHEVEARTKLWETEQQFQQKQKQAELEAREKFNNSPTLVGLERRKIDIEMELRQHRLEKEAALRAKYPDHFDQTKNIGK